jgi:hypothetical protein
MRTIVGELACTCGGAVDCVDAVSKAINLCSAACAKGLMKRHLDYQNSVLAAALWRVLLLYQVDVAVFDLPYQVGWQKGCETMYCASTDGVWRLAVDARATYSDCRVMTNTRLPSSVFFALALLAAAQYAYYAPRLPEVLGSHFAANGTVNGWQSKAAFFSMELAIVVLAAAVGFAVPRIIGAMPVSLINLPNREFWLSPERRAETLGFLQMHMAWFGCALLAFLLFVMELAFRANLLRPPRLNSAAFVPALVVFLVFVGIFTVRLVARFSKLP